MFDFTSYIKNAARQGVQFSLDGDVLRLGGRKQLLTADLIEKIKSNKQQVVSSIRDGVDLSTHHGLSYNQKSLWFINDFLPNSPAYNIGVSTRVKFSFDRNLLRLTLEKLIFRHDALRAIYPEISGVPRQLIQAYKAPELSYIDVAGLDEEQLRRRVTDESDRPFDLKSGGVFRAVVFELSASESVLLLSIHHIAFDGWSGQVLLTDFWTIYYSLLLGKPLDLQPIKARYVDFVAWQERYLQSEAGAADIEYWCEQLSGDLPVSSLPIDRPRPSVVTNNGGSFLFDLPADLVADIKAFEKSQPQTLFMIMLAAYFVLLHRYSEQQDIIVGSPAAGRNNIDYWGVCGYFINPIALRASMASSFTFTDILKQVQHLVLSGLKHQDCPLGLLVEKLQPPRDPSRNAIFQVMFILQRAHEMDSASGLTEKLCQDEQELLSTMLPEPYLIAEEEGQFDLLLSVWELADGIQGVWKYSADIFDRESIEAMRDDYIDVLRVALAEPGGPIADIPLTILSAQERQLGLLKWQKSNLTISEYHHWQLSCREGKVDLHHFRCAVTESLNVEAFRAAVDRCVIDGPVCERIISVTDGIPQVLRQTISTSKFYFRDLISADGAVDDAECRLDSAVDAIALDAITVETLSIVLTRLAEDSFCIDVRYPPIAAGSTYAKTLLEDIERYYRFDAACADVSVESASPVFEQVNPLLLESARVYWSQQQTAGLQAISFYGKAKKNDSCQREIKTFHIDGDDYHSLKALAAAEGLDTLILTSLSIFIYRISAERQFSIAINHACGTADTVYPLTVTLDGAEQYQTLRQRLTLSLNQASQHLHYYPSPMQTCTQSAALFDYYTGEMQGEWAAAIEGFSSIQPGIAEDCPLILSVREDDKNQCLKLSVSFLCSAFSTDMLSEASDQLQRIVSSFLTKPSIAIDSICLSDPQFDDFCSSGMALPLSSCKQGGEQEGEQKSEKEHEQKQLLDYFYKQVADFPDSQAVVVGSDSITYSDLDDKSTQLAHYLSGCELDRAAPVAILMDKSIDLIVAVLAVWKSGLAYLPLDPGYPLERLQHMIENSGASFLLMDSISGSLTDSDSLAGLFPSHLCVDEPETVELLSGLLSERLSNRGDDYSTAYMIYTSGTTGRPKGVEVKHASLFNAFLAWQQAYDLAAAESHLQMASFSFDVFVGDLVRALGSGGRLVLCNKEQMLHGKTLFSLIEQHNITVAEFVPAILRNLVDYLQAESLSLQSIRLLLVGSDNWYLAEYARIKAYLPETSRLINSYGVSECTIDSTYYEISDLSRISDEQLGDSVPIGRPFTNVEVYVLGEQMNRLAPGIAGELYIGGAGVAAGYHKLADLTAERFVNNPFSCGDSRLYRTGDMARILPDMNLELLGRMDRQLKLRGVRIEPGEIESQLVCHLEVKQALANVVTDDSGVEHLLVFAVLIDAATIDETSLLDFLCQSLPAFMLPSRIIIMQRLPLTPNGKLDMAGLPIVSFSGASSASEECYVAAGNSIESRLADLWGELLSLPRVSVEADFFRLGGHSLLAVEMLFRCRKLFALKVPLMKFMQATNIRALAQLIVAQQQATGDKQGSDGLLSSALSLGYEAKSIELFSPAHSEDYSIYIARPMGQAEHECLPVVYVLDAELRFEQVLQTAKRLHISAIFVGVANGEWRNRDYMPSNSHTPLGGGHEEFLSFMLEQLLPYIDGEYVTDVSQRILVGHSYSGVFASYVMSQDRQAQRANFSGYIICEPSWQLVADFMVSLNGLCGTQELAVNCHLSWATEGYGDYLANNWQACLDSEWPGFDLQYAEYEATHESVVQYAFADGLRWLLTAEAICA